MKLNPTTVLLFAVVALVGWFVLKPKLFPTANGEAVTNNEVSGKTNTGQPDVLNSVLNAVNSIFGAVSSIAQSQPKNN